MLYSPSIPPPHVVRLHALALGDARVAGVVRDEAPCDDGGDKLADGPPGGEEGEGPLEGWLVEVSWG